MSDQVREVAGSSRQKKWIAGLSIALTLVVGILIGTVISGKTSAMKNFSFAGKGTPLAVPDSIPSSNSFAGIVNRVEPAVVNISTTQVMEKKPAAKHGNSDGVQVGDWVLAIGSPFGLQATVTAGIISAKDRGGVGRQFQKFLQTDAAINPGNSGGPLVDMAGEVIGVNTAIITGSRGYEGVGFALPSTVAINVYNQPISSVRLTRGSIGVSFQEELGTNAITLKELGAQHGVVIMSVEPGSPAEKAGLKGGDVITTVNGTSVKSGNDLVNPIAQAPIGSKVKLTYVRDGQAKETTATVEDRTRVFPNYAGRMNDQPGDASPAEFYHRVENLTPDRALRIGIERQKAVY